MKPLIQFADVLDRISDKILVLCKWSTMVVVGTITGIIFVGVFWRYVLGDALAWYEESAKYLMMWLVFLASPIVLKNTGHVAIDNLPRILPERLKYALYVVVFTAVLFLLYQFVIPRLGPGFERLAAEDHVDPNFLFLGLPVGAGGQRHHGRDYGGTVAAGVRRHLRSGRGQFAVIR